MALCGGEGKALLTLNEGPLFGCLFIAWSHRDGQQEMRLCVQNHQKRHEERQQQEQQMGGPLRGSNPWAG